MSSSTPTRVKGVRLDVDLDKMGEGFMSSMKAVGNSVSKVGEGIVDVTKKVGDGVVDGAKKVGDGAKDLSSKVVEPLKASPRLPSTPASMHAPVAAPDDFWKGTTCLVIGGAGNLGGHIVQLLLERSARVASFDLVAYSGESTEVASFVGSVTDRAALEAAMEGVGVVIHTASIIDLRPIPSLRMQQINVAGTYEVVGACKACGVHTLVYTSSIEVVSGVDEHGVTRLIDGVDESAPIPPRHHLPYAATKAAAERLVLAAHSPRGLRTVAIRSAYIFGANSLGQRIEMVRAHDRRGHYVTAKVPATLSTVHAKNCALAHLRAAERADKADVGGKPFFVRDFEANVVEMNLECFACASATCVPATSGSQAAHLGQQMTSNLNRTPATPTLASARSLRLQRPPAAFACSLAGSFLTRRHALAALGAAARRSRSSSCHCGSPTVSRSCCTTST